VARGDHPERTPLYGALLIVAAMLAGLAVQDWTHPPTALRVAVLVLALVAAIVGVGMTLRDLTPPRRR
jgi:UDP-N-acetylmuramyl pentapeptide phosphotransferase/UDP-N-acetylglucosamine-1-phosphate transferase